MNDKFRKKIDKVDDLCDDTLKYAEAISYLMCSAWLKLGNVGEQYTRKAVEECIITPAYSCFDSFIAQYARGDFN